MRESFILYVKNEVDFTQSLTLHLVTLQTNSASIKYLLSTNMLQLQFFYSNPLA